MLLDTRRVHNECLLLLESARFADANNFCLVGGESLFFRRFVLIGKEVNGSSYNNNDGNDNDCGNNLAPTKIASLCR